MCKVKGLFLCFISLLHCACNQHPQVNAVTNAPEVLEAKGYVVPQDSVVPPKVIPIGIETRVLAGKPNVVSVISNGSPVGKPEIVPAGIPKKNIPGQGIFKLPDTIPVTDHPIPGGIPEVVVAKGASVKDNNPDNFSSFQVLQGLRHPLIDCMMQDKSGNLWIGTFNGGISKYDGKFFTNYTSAEGLSYEGVWSMIEDKKGNLWFGTCGGGVCKFDGTYFTNYSVKDGLGYDIIISIFQDGHNNIWFGTNGGGVTKYDGKNFVTYTMKHGLPNDNVHAIAEDNSGNLWFGTLGGGVSKFDGNSFSNYTTFEGLSNNYINAICKDRKGDLWFATNKGVSKFNASAWFSSAHLELLNTGGNNFTNYTVKQGLTNDIVNCIFEDRYGIFWFGTQNGITEFNESTSQFIYHRSAQGLSNDKVTCIIEDNGGTIWCGTKGGGINRYDGKLFNHFTEKQGLCNDEIMSILEDKDKYIWFSSWGGGVSKYDGKSFSNYSSAQGLCDHTVYGMIQDSKNNFWFGTQHGVSKFDGTYFTTYNELNGLTAASVWSILEDKQGNIWFGTFGDGAIKYDGKSFTHYSVEQGLSNVFVMTIAEDQNNNIWFGIYGGGVCRYDGKSFTQYTKEQGLKSDFVMPLMGDRSGNFWIGTIGSGLIKYDGKNFTNYSTPQGLSNTIVMGMLQSRDGNLWFSTRNGLNKLVRDTHLDSDPTENKSSPYFKNYSFGDGFLGVNCYLHSILEDCKGQIWIGTSDRLTCFHREGEIHDTIPPNIQLINISLYNENLNWLDLQKHKDTTIYLSNGVQIANFNFEGLTKWYNVPKNLSLAYNNSFLTFKFIGIATHSTSKINYQYKLDGLETNWNAITDRNEAPYGNLPNGSYTFKVKAMNSEGYWSPEISYAFEIRPPWWKTWWFRLAVVLAVSLLLYGIYRYRLNQLMKLQNVRNKIAGDLHDDIGSTLSSINIFTELAKKQAKEASPLLDQIGEHSQKMLDSMSDIVWTINPENDTFEKIILRMRSFAYDLLGAKDIEFEFNVEELTEKIKLPMTVRKNLYLIFKEATNNMAKYSEATKAFFSIRYVDHKLKFLIRDNGKGFDKNQDRPDNRLMGGNGMKNMQRRASEIGAQLRVESESGKGTSIELEWRMK